MEDDHTTTVKKKFFKENETPTEVIKLKQDNFVTWIKVEEVGPSYYVDSTSDPKSDTELPSHQIKQRLSQIQMQSLQNKNIWAKKITITEIIAKLDKKGYREIYALGDFNGNTLCTFEPSIAKDGRIFIKYTQNMKEFAVVLNYHKPEAYSYARNELLTCLPHPLAISKWYLSTGGNPGLTEESFEALRNYCLSEKKLACLLVDDIELKHYRDFYGIPVYSCVTYGPEKELARYAFVLMLVSLDGSFKLPLGYFYMKNLTTEQRCNIIKLCLERCHDVGAEVVSLTLDSWSSTISTARLLGCNFDDFENLKTHFSHPVTKKPVVVFFDQCYILKQFQLTVEWNTLIDLNGGEVQWKYLQSLKDVQDNLEKHLEDKLFTPKLIELRTHLLNLKLPVQDLHENAANAMKICANDLKLPEFNNADATINFIELLSTVFDVLNTNSLNTQRFPVDDKDQLFQILDFVDTYLRSLKVQVQSTKSRSKNDNETTLQPLMKTETKQGLLELLTSICSYKTLFMELVEKRQILKYIPSYNFNLDHLVFFFAEIHNDEKTPNTRQFKKVYKKLLLKLKRPSKLTQSSVSLERIPILKCAAEINKTTPGFRLNFREDRTTRKPNDEEMKKCLIVSEMLDDDYPMKEAICYLLQYIAEQLRAKIDCTLCLKLLPATKYFNICKLITSKKIEEVRDPSVVLFKICLAAEMFLKLLLRMNDNDHCLAEENNLRIVIKECFAKVMEKKDIRFILQESHPFDSHHDNLFLKCVIEEYLRVRLHTAVEKSSWCSAFLPKFQLNILSCH